MKTKAIFAVALSVAAVGFAGESARAQEASIYHNNYRVIPPLGAAYPNQFRPYLAYRQPPPQWRVGMTFQKIIMPVIRQSRRIVAPQLQNCVNGVATTVQMQTNFCCEDNLPEGFYRVR